MFVRKQHPDVQAFGNGLNELDAGNYEKSIPYFQSYVRKNPNSPEGQFDIGLAYLQGHHPDEAITAFQNVLKITPNAGAERGLAFAYKDKGMQQEADDALSKAKEMEEKK